MRAVSHFLLFAEVPTIERPSIDCLYSASIFSFIALFSLAVFVREMRSACSSIGGGLPFLYCPLTEFKFGIGAPCRYDIGIPETTRPPRLAPAGFFYPPLSSGAPKLDTLTAFLFGFSPILRP